MRYVPRKYSREELQQMSKEELIIELLIARNAFMELQITSRLEEKKVLSGGGGKSRLNFKNVN
jgi:hypothetical protein